MELHITTLIENNEANIKGLCFEHGLSLYLEFKGLKLLFDTGQSGDFIDNAHKLNINLDDLDYVLMSHGHYDHSGGFKKLMPLLSKQTKIVIAEDFFRHKCKDLYDGSYKQNGNSFSLADIKDCDLETILIHDDLTKLNDDIYIIKNFKQTNDYEIIPSKFKIYENGQYICDDFRDEIALAIKTSKGLVVIVGCSHRGIVNILSDIQTKLDLPIIGLIGGTHLVEADESRIAKTIAYLDNLDLDFIAFSHCTGPAITTLKEHFKDKFIFNNTANTIDI